LVHGRETTHRTAAAAKRPGCDRRTGLGAPSISTSMRYVRMVRPFWKSASGCHRLSREVRIPPSGISTRPDALFLPGAPVLALAANAPRIFLPLPGRSLGGPRGTISTSGWDQSDALGPRGVVPVNDVLTTTVKRSRGSGWISFSISGTDITTPVRLSGMEC
jgi:hypothetical protein